MSRLQPELGMGRHVAGPIYREPSLRGSATDDRASRQRGAAIIDTSPGGRTAVATAIRVLVVFGAVSFLLGSLLHLGVQIPLGFAVLDEPWIIQAGIVEGLCGLAFAGATYAVFARRPWAWTTTIGAVVVGLAGVVLGTWAIAAGRGPESVLNDTYHRVMLLLLPAGLILLLTSAAQAELDAVTSVDEAGATTTGDGATVARPGRLLALKAIVGLFAALVLAQALLGGRGWFIDRELFAIHGGIGGGVVLVAALQAVLAFAVGAPAIERRHLAVVSALILLLVATQYILGFAGRESSQAAAWHIPNGALIFGLASANSVIVFRLNR